VREVRVRDGQLVEQGQVLMVLQNEQLAFELADLRLALQQSQLLGRSSETKMKVAETQIHLEDAKVLQHKINEKQAQVDQLSIRAPHQGTVIGRGLNALMGVFLRHGDEILTIGSEGHKELQISVAQEDLPAFSSRLGRLVQVRVSGADAGQSRLVGLQPRATVHVEHPALCAAAGGPLPVRWNGSQLEGQSRQMERFEFLSPRFSGTVALNATQSRQSRCGQLATVSFQPSRETLGGHLCALLVKWIEDKLQQTDY
jgi:putative peptide zinc metalloprotease protein